MEKVISIERIQSAILFIRGQKVLLDSDLESERAIQVSIQIIKTFIRLRRMLASNQALARKLLSLENKYDLHFDEIFEAIGELMAPPEPKNHRRLGFRQNASRSQIVILKKGSKP